jgi:hypothetical protein
MRVIRRAGQQEIVQRLEEMHEERLFLKSPAYAEEQARSSHLAEEEARGLANLAAGREKLLSLVDQATGNLAGLIEIDTRAHGSYQAGEIHSINTHCERSVAEDLLAEKLIPGLPNPCYGAIYDRELRIVGDWTGNECVMLGAIPVAHMSEEYSIAEEWTAFYIFGEPVSEKHYDDFKKFMFSDTSLKNKIVYVCGLNARDRELPSSLLTRAEEIQDSVVREAYSRAQDYVDEKRMRMDTEACYAEEENIQIASRPSISRRFFDDSRNPSPNDLGDFINVIRANNGEIRVYFGAELVAALIYWLDGSQTPHCSMLGKPVTHSAFRSFVEHLKPESVTTWKAKST